MISESVQNVPREVLSVDHVWAGYDGDMVLEDVSFTVNELDFIGLIGPNGGGKTTLLRVLLGLLEPKRGEVRVMGLSVSEGRRHIGYVPQMVSFDQAFPISVWDVARMGRLGTRRLLHRYTAEDDDLVAKALKDVGMLHLRNRAIGGLSGGQRQRVYIARALVTQPSVLLLDEPLSSVDPQTSTSIYELLGRLNEHISILLVSHDMSAVSANVKTVGCLNRRLYYHRQKRITPDMMQSVYGCPIDLIAHGVPHRVFEAHISEESEG